MKRILLKLSGEALSGGTGKGLDCDTVKGVAAQIKEITAGGVSCGIVIGGGNFWRGDEHQHELERARADEIGMLATVMNCLYAAEVFRAESLKTKVFCSFTIEGIAEHYSRDAVLQALDEGTVVFFAGGTGNPYFSTDTGTVLRALQIGADTILMAKSVDGVYDKDPEKYPDAVRYDRISIGEVVEKRLGVIDGAAAAMLLENPLPLFVFDLLADRSIVRAVEGMEGGTVVTAQ